MAAMRTAALPTRDRAAVIAGLAAITALAWAYILYLASTMRGAGDMSMAVSRPMDRAWGVVDLGLTFVMWAVMMVAMMTPSALPMVLAFAAVNRRRLAARPSFVATAAFVLGYLVLWAAFSVAAALIQWPLHDMALLSPLMAATHPLLAGGLLVAAGIYQLTPLKRACLSHCRSPLGFIMTEWREGARGAFVMGLRHGAYCVGCCWLLMALLFVAGVMNPLWVLAIAAYILFEKVAPAGTWVSRAAGLAAAGWGAWLLLSRLV